MTTFCDLTNKTFGRLFVKECLGRINKHDIYYKCICSCGNEKRVGGKHLSAGDESCGCLRREIAPLHAKTIHGHARRHRHTREYRSWKSMMARCYNERTTGYKQYGGRGITVCERWHEFNNFLTDMGPQVESNVSLDRKDNNGKLRARQLPMGYPRNTGKEYVKKCILDARRNYKNSNGLVLRAWS